MRRQVVFVAITAGLLACGCSRPVAQPVARPVVRPVAPARLRALTFSELKANLTVATPIFRLVGGVPSGHWSPRCFQVWADYGDGVWAPVFAAGGVPASELPEGKPVEFPLLLTATPRAVRVGVSGYYTGPLYVDHLELVFPDGTRMAPTKLLPVNSVTDLDNAVGSDGKVATIWHVAMPSPSVPTVIDGVDAFFENPPAQWRDAKWVPLATQAPVPRFGVYYNPGGDGDPHEAPLDWVYRPDPGAIAFYDFGMPQGNTPELFAKVKTSNPRHRLIVQVRWPAVNPLDYTYDPAVRKKTLQAVRSNLAHGAEHFYGVFLGDEEPQYFYSGWHASEMPDWVKRHQADYEREQPGKPFDWKNQDLRNWIISKGPQLFNDIYDTVKSMNARLKVLPFVYLPGDNSGWGFWDPKLIKADGWVVQWYDPDTSYQRPLRLSMKHASGIGSVWVMEKWFNRSIQQLRERGIPTEEIYCQIWAYRPEDDAVAQAEKVMAAGVGNIWIFYNWAWIPPPPRMARGPRCLAFKIHEAEQPAPWLAQTTVDAWQSVGYGVAQRLVAGAAIGKVAIQVRAKDTNAACQVALYEENQRLPAPTPLASSPLDLPAGTDGWVEVALPARVKVQQPYFLAVVPRDLRTPQSGVLVGISERAPYDGGDLIPRTVVPGYFDGWQSYQSNESWASTYRQRLEFERYVQWWRKQRDSDDHP